MERETKEKKQNHIRIKGGRGGGQMDELHRALKNLMQRAYELQQVCDSILKECCGVDGRKLPINIEKIASAQGVELAYQNLNSGGSEEIDLNIAQLRYESDKKGRIIRKIYVDNSSTDLYVKTDSDSYSNLQKYAIAYELGKIIIKEEYKRKITQMDQKEMNKRNMTSVPYSLPKLYARQESFEYEMCAIFLLLPMDLFFEEFHSYLKGNRVRPVYMEKWIKYLSERTEIPNYQLINGYQYIKFCACQYYKERQGKEGAEQIYWDLFR